MGKLDMGHLAMEMLLSYEEGKKPDWNKLAVECGSASGHALQVAWYTHRKRYRDGKLGEAGSVSEAKQGSASKVKKPTIKRNGAGKGKSANASAKKIVKKEEEEELLTTPAADDSNDDVKHRTNSVDALATTASATEGNSGTWKEELFET